MDALPRGDARQGHRDCKAASVNPTGASATGWSGPSLRAWGFALLLAVVVLGPGCAKRDHESGDGNVSNESWSMTARNPASGQQAAASAQPNAASAPPATGSASPAEALPAPATAAAEKIRVAPLERAAPAPDMEPPAQDVPHQRTRGLPPRAMAKRDVEPPAPDIQKSLAPESTKSVQALAPTPNSSAPGSAAAPQAVLNSPETLLPRLDERAAMKQKSAALETADGQIQRLADDEVGPVTKVRVFYGTDRAVLEEIEQARPSDRWFHGTALATSITICLAGLCLLRPSRTLQIASALGVGVTIVLGSVTLYVARYSVPEISGNRAYGVQRGSLETGYCDVTIPQAHEVGRVERPSVFRLELVENPLKHVVLQTVRELPADRFYEELKSRVAASDRKEAFVFIHGYNVDFNSAARRTAQIAHDLCFDGAPIFYSWPSQGNPLGYTVDETNVVWTVPHLKEFLVSVARQSGAKAVHLVAHSMGNRALTEALKELFYELDAECPRFHDVVLTAPDIDAEVFRRDLAPAVMRTARRVTLYASSNDEALVLSKKVHGYARAGDSGDFLVVVPGMDTIDVSDVDTSLLGHSYYGNNHTVLADLYDLLREWKPPEQRKFLRSMYLGSMRYWTFIR